LLGGGGVFHNSIVSSLWFLVASFRSKKLIPRMIKVTETIP
jgi:hypothetical protein